MCNTFQRYEYKYLVNKYQYDALLDELSEHGFAIDSYGATSIQSLYYDTPEDLLILRSLQKPVYKEKLRLRCYGTNIDDSNVFLEIKKKYDGIIYKRRIKTTEDEALSFIANRQDYETQIGKELNCFRDTYKSLMPKMLIVYEREAFYGKDTELRITFDSNIRYRTDDLNLRNPKDGTNVLDSDMRVMEIKSSKAYPLWLVKILSDNQIYKSSFSKYGTAYLQEMKYVNKSNERTNNIWKTSSHQYSPMAL